MEAALLNGGMGIKLVLPTATGAFTDEALVLDSEDCKMRGDVMAGGTFAENALPLGR